MEENAWFIIGYNNLTEKNEELMNHYDGGGA
jgi:hypothetical protein